MDIYKPMRWFRKAAHFGVLLLVAMLVVPFALSAFASAQEGLAGAITGVVTDSAHGGVGNIRVEAYASVADFNGGNNGTVAAMTETAADGSYTLSDVPAGSYFIVFNLQGGGNPNYVQQFYNNKSTIESADPVTVAEGSTTSDINAVLETAGHIAGRVTDATGTPLANIRVDAYTSVEAYNNGYNGTATAIAETTADGTYDMGTLPAGNYLIVFNQGGGGNNPTYITGYYHNQPTIGMADSVAVAAGETTPHIDARLTIPGRVAGRVIDWSGNGIENIKVIVYASLTDYQNGISATYGHTEADGSYTLGGLPEGNYFVSFNQNVDMYYHANFETQFYNGQSTPLLANYFAVTADTTTSGIDAQLATLGGPTDKSQCKNGGWRNFSNPVFKNQGQCVKYVEHHN